MNPMLGDFLSGFRRLGRQPLVTTIAVLSLAVGLAAAAGVTSLLDAFGFRPLAVSAPETLVRIQTSSIDGGRSSFTWDAVADLRSANTAFDQVAGSMTRGAALTSTGRPPDIVWLGVVTANYFSMLGVTPAAGRTFTDADDRAGAMPVVWLSHSRWERQFQSNPAVIGASVHLNGTACTVVGVAPADFTGLDLVGAPDFWIPAATWPQLFNASRGARPTLAGSSERNWDAVARLRSGVPVDAANAAVQPLLAGLIARMPSDTPPSRLTVVDLQEARLGNLTMIRNLIWVLVGLVILVGCANVASLLLGQAEARQREFAIRTALGADRGRLSRMLCAESAGLAALAGGAGLALGWWTIRVLPSIIPPSPIPFGLEFRFDHRVVVVTTLLSLATVLVFSLWPALRAARRDVSSRLGRSAAPAVTGLRWLTTRHVLVVAQVTVCSALLVVGGLLVRSAGRSQALPSGFAHAPILLTTIVPGLTGTGSAGTRTFLVQLQDRLTALPGVASAAFARSIPLSLMGGGGTRDITIPTAPDSAPRKVRFNAVSAGYFATMGTRVVRGRPITSHDNTASPRVALVNATMARQHWTEETAVGQIIDVKGVGSVEIVGVAEDGKYNRLSEPAQPYVFFAANQTDMGETTLIVRARGDHPSALAPDVRAVLLELDPGLPVLQMLTLDDHLRLSTFDLHLGQIVLMVLGGAGLLLSVTGLYAVVAYAVERRTREFGIRVALGASPSGIGAMVVRYALTLCVCGLAIGLPVAFVAALSLAPSLYGLSPGDPITYGSIGVLVAGVTLAATWAPARRAMGTNPAILLRQE